MGALHGGLIAKRLTCQAQARPHGHGQDTVADVE